MPYLCTVKLSFLQSESTSLNSKIVNGTGLLNFLQRHHRHLIWMAIFCIMILLFSRHQSPMAAVVLAVVTILPMLIDSTVLHLYLLPCLLRRHPLYFGIIAFLLLCLLTMLATWFDNWAYEMVYSLDLTKDSPRDTTPERINLLLLNSKYAFLLLCTTAGQTVDYLIAERRREAQTFHEQQMQEQLKYLRAQINPHFLFNALNCIYTLTMIQDEKAPDSVLKLSEMLRYVIDDCRADQVPLTKEVHYIRNYIDFQRIRMEHEPNLTFDVQISDPQYSIPPMLLQPVIENCFKHSRLVDDPNAWIHILIRQNESGLLFTCDNSKPAATTFSRQSAIIGRKDEERTGIGLMNVQQRLAMLFGDKCSLKVIEDDTHYKTILHV